MDRPQNETRSEPRFLDQVRRAIRLAHLSLRTEKAYLHWIRKYILYHRKKHPAEMGEVEISAFLTHLAADRNVSASTQNQALSALLFLYRAVLERDLGRFPELVRAKRRRKLPGVLTQEEVRRVVGHLQGVDCLFDMLLYLIVA